MVARSTRFPISGSSIRPSAFRHSDFSPRAVASCLNPCSKVARHKPFLTLVCRFRPFACWPPSQPSYAFHPRHGPPILWWHDTRGSRHRFQRSSLRFSAALLTFLRLPRSSSQIPARCYQCFSVARHTRFPTSAPAFVPLHFGSSTTIPRLHSRKRSSRPAQAPPASGCFSFLPRP
jgi:hypothetical protein